MSVAFAKCQKLIADQLGKTYEILPVYTKGMNL